MRWLLFAALLVVLGGIGVANPVSVPFRLWYGGADLHLPLYVVITGCLFSGFLAGVLAVWSAGVLRRLRRG